MKIELNKNPEKNEPKRKIVIFSEYQDTVDYLEPILRKKFSNRVLVVSKQLSNEKINNINKNFDATYKPQENNYDILLATDKISEGYNLNRAGLVINYDIPWNPVRVIQRVGRINRISKKVFENIYIVNFFPTEKGDHIINNRKIAEQKMFLIHSTLGEDSKIFDIDEEPGPSDLFRKIQKNPDSLETNSFYNKILTKFLQIKEQSPKLIKAIDHFPTRVKVSKSFNENELLVFIKKGHMYIHHHIYEDNKTYQVNLEEILDHVSCEETETAQALSAKFWDAYKDIRKQKSQESTYNETSLEQQATNNLKSFLQNPSDEISPYIDFVSILLEDIKNYGTLPDYTLRRIANIEQNTNKTSNEILKLKQELGEDYLLKEKARQRNINKEIIIAIENKKA